MSIQVAPGRLTDHRCCRNSGERGTPGNLPNISTLESRDEDRGDQLARDAMRLVSSEPSDESIANAIQILTILGQDSMSGDLWNVATASGNVGALTAHAALPSLFRLSNTDGFLWAFSLIQKPTSLERDMLWQLVGTDDKAPLQVLIDNLNKLI